MLITCENCSAVYSISNTIIGESGRKVKCVKCSHVWEVMPISAKLKDKAEPEVRTKKIIIYKSSNFLSYLLLLIICFLSLIAFQNSLIKVQPFKNLYSLFHIYDNSGIQLSDVNYKIVDNNLLINAKLENNSGEIKKIPEIRFILLDDNRNIIFRAISEQNQKNILPNEKLPISVKILNLNYHAAYLQIDTFNVIEVALHKNLQN